VNRGQYMNKAREFVILQTNINYRLLFRLARINIIHMKRTNVVIREDLLEEATRLSGERTYSKTIERALEDFVRRIKARRILELTGSGLWEGNLSAMRRDSVKEKRSTYRRVSRR
jgi:hypothetical protein